MNKYITSLSRALWDSDLIATRITLFFGEMLWAVMLLWSGDTFSQTNVCTYGSYNERGTMGYSICYVCNYTTYYSAYG